MRRLVRTIFGLKEKNIDIDYSSSLSIRTGLYKAGYRSFEPPILKSFQDEIKNLAKNRIRKLFRNGTPEHTSVILSEMLKNGNKEFLIYDRDLSGDLLLRNDNKSLLENFESFLESEKGEIQIIVDPNTIINSSVKEKLRPLTHNRKLKIFQLEEISLNENLKLKQSPYFAVLDKRAFRIEEKNDLEGREAICNFNDPETSEDLTQLFSSLKEAAVEVEF